MLEKCPDGCACEDRLDSAWALYDNPKTQCREFWVDGQCEHGLPWAAIAIIPIMGATREDRDDDVVCPGKIRGNARAIAANVLRESSRAPYG